MKKKLFFTLSAVGLVCAAVLFLVAAGGQARSGGAVSGSAANVNPPGQFPICKTPITVNMAIQTYTNVENYETNDYTKWIEEKGNLKIDFDIYPAGSAGMEKILITVAAGGVLPELLMSFGFSDQVLLNWGAEGIIQSLNPFFGTWDYFIPRQLEKLSNKDLWNWMHSADGNVYYLPFIMEFLGEYYSLRGWINQRWLDKLGLKTPSTTEEFRAVLEAFRDRDPNGNGLRDEIPAGGNTDQRGRLHDFLINAFIYNDTRDRLIVNNGVVDVIYNKPEYREALRYVHGLMADGLILDQLFTINGPGLRGIIESGGENGMVGFFTAGLAGAISPNNRMRLDYEPIPPLRGPRGANFTPYMPMEPQKRFVMTKDARNPEAIFRLGDFMCSEEASIWNRFGMPERDWRGPRPGEKSMYDAIGMAPTIAEILPWGAIQNASWVQGAPAIFPLGLIDGMIASDNPLNNEIWIAKAAQMYMNNAPPSANRVDKTIHTSQEMEQMADLKTAINGYVNENLALFCTGQRSLERDWDAYIRELDRIGLRRYIELSQSGYERAIGKKR